VLSCFLAGSSTQRYADGLTPRDDDWIVSKQYPSAFFGASLAATLTANGVDTLVITGLTTSGWVRATCVDSMSHGFITLVVRDAVGDRDPRPHEANLYDMNAKYADVVPEPEAAGYLRSTAAARSPTEPRSANPEQREGS
jgi:maleamate amidohydrolase